MSSMLPPSADLTPFNSFGLPGRAQHLLRVESVGQLSAALAAPELAALPRTLLGGGSNVIVSGDIEGLVLQVAIRGREVLAREGRSILVRAGAGESWHAFVEWTLAQQAYGLENLALIPGSVGASPIQNIGAYGVEAGERIETVECFDFATRASFSLSGRECAFGYRDSCFKHRLAGRVLVTAVTFRLDAEPAPRYAYADLRHELEQRGCTMPTPQDVFDAVCTVRQRKLPDPARIGNAGSFFKNPLVDAALAARLRGEYPELVAYAQADGRVKLAAGWLIERCGWKGRRLGPVGVYDRQALVLVNHGGATGAEVLALAAAIRADVEARFGVTLEQEPVVL